MTEGSYRAGLKIVGFLMLSIAGGTLLLGQSTSITGQIPEIGKDKGRSLQGNPPPSADLTLEKTAPLTVAAVDDLFSYTLKVCNQGTR